MSALEIVMVAVAGALILFIVLASIVWKYYKKLTKHKAIEFKLYNTYAHPEKIVFLGDSLTDFFPVNECLPDFEVYNRGIAGNLTYDVLERLQDVTDLKPKQLFLQIGINDLISRGKKKTEPAALTDRIMQIADAFPEAEVFISSLYPVNRKKSVVSKIICLRARNKKIRAVNEELRNRCAEKGYTFIDMFPLLTDAAGNLKREYTIEGLHLTAEGYGVITEVYQKYLKKEA